MRIAGLFEHQHRASGKAQFTGEKQADRTGAGDQDIMEFGQRYIHGLAPLSMFDRSVPRNGTHADEHGNALRRSLLVAGIPAVRPKTRASVTGRTWAYQTKSAFSDFAYLTRSPLSYKRAGTRLPGKRTRSGCRHIARAFTGTPCILRVSVPESCSRLHIAEAARLRWRRAELTRAALNDQYRDRWMPMRTT